jgi:Uma2 family endonuclease
MIQAIPKQITFDEFITWYPDNSETCYELHNGVIVEMPKPSGKHSEIAGFLTIELGLRIRQAKLAYFIPKECIIKPLHNQSGYEPDVILLDKQSIENEPRWERESIIMMGNSAPLVVEVVSTNWHDDYALKLEDYAAMGIQEYWIADYLGLGGRKFIGYPKRPALSVCQLVDGEYQVRLFRDSDLIESLVFPELDLIVEQVFQASL